MEFVAGLQEGDDRLDEWANRIEDQGWHGIGVGDHLRPNGWPYGHLFSTLGYLASKTSRVQLISTYANVLLRSPVEFAHAAFSLQALSGGRFEAGLGAGWAQSEVEAMGFEFPSGGERARRFFEAASIVSEIVHTGHSRYSGQFYRADVDDIGVQVGSPPPLVVAVGGPWTCENVAPLADRVEVVPFAKPLRSGQINLRGWSDGSPEDVALLADAVKVANPTAPLSIGCFVAAGSGPAIERVKKTFGDGPLSGLAGTPSEVADTLHSFGSLGIDRCMIGEFAPGSLDALVDHVL